MQETVTSDTHDDGAACVLSTRPTVLTAESCADRFSDVSNRLLQSAVQPRGRIALRSIQERYTA